MANWTKGPSIRINNQDTGGVYETQNLWHKGKKLLVAVAQVAGMPAISKEDKKIITDALNGFNSTPKKRSKRCRK